MKWRLWGSLLVGLWCGQAQALTVTPGDYIVEGPYFPMSLGLELSFTRPTLPRYDPANPGHMEGYTVEGGAISGIGRSMSASWINVPGSVNRCGTCLTEHGYSTVFEDQTLSLRVFKAVYLVFQGSFPTQTPIENVNFHVYLPEGFSLTPVSASAAILSTPIPGALPMFAGAIGLGWLLYRRRRLVPLQTNAG